MAVTLNRRAFDHAKELINEGRIALDERDAAKEQLHIHELSCPTCIHNQRTRT